MDNSKNMILLRSKCKMFFTLGYLYNDIIFIPLEQNWPNYCYILPGQKTIFNVLLIICSGSPGQKDSFTFFCNQHLAVDFF